MPTDIEWVKNDDGSKGASWNPVRGCRLTSPGCSHCYAMTQAHRFSGPGGAYEGLTKLRAKGGPVWTGDFREVPDMLDVPFRTRKPTTWFVNSMSDLFGEGVSNEFIASVFGVMAATPGHTYQVLTKRAERLPEWAEWIHEQGLELIDAVGETPGPRTSADGSACIYLLGEHHDLGNRAAADAYNNAPWPLPNVWLGVSVEDRKHGLPRIEHLRRTPAAVHWLSIEPLLEDLGDELDLAGIDWVVVGGESGNGARPMHPDWVRRIRDKCVASNTPFFFKQWGAWQPFYDRDLDDPDWRKVPTEEPNVQRINLTGGLGFHGERVVYLRRVGKKSAGRLLDGRTWDEMPARRAEVARA